MSEVKELQFKAEMIYGHAVLDSWFEFDGEKYIGMGSKVVYDENGNIMSYEKSPTGLIAYYS